MLEVRNVPFCVPSFSDQDIAEITGDIGKALSAGQLTQGPRVKEFEDRWAEYVGTKFAVAVSSCTAALHIMLQSMGIGQGDEVLVPSLTFASTANAAIYCGARPVFVEVDPVTLNMSPDALESVIRSREPQKIKAIIPVHLAGQPCQMDRIIEIAERSSIPVVEDCAHAHGSSYQGQRCGSFGEGGCFSFYPTKVMAGAEGGMITTDSAAIAERARLLRNIGRSGLGPLEITEIGYNFRMNEPQAIICLNQFRNLGRILAQRRAVIDRYNELLGEVEGVTTPRVIEGATCSNYAYIVKVDNRDSVREALSERGIGTSIMYHPVHLQPIYQQLFGYREGALPVTEKASRQLLSLPVFPKMTAGDVDYVVEALREITTAGVKREQAEEIAAGGNHSRAAVGGSN